MIKPEPSLTNGLRKVGRLLQKICGNMIYFISRGNPSQTGLNFEFILWEYFSSRIGLDPMKEK